MVDRLDLTPGFLVAGKYEVICPLGAGWEGEVYLTREKHTGIERTAKFFYPKRNKQNRAAKKYAQKLHRLRHVSAITQYHTQEIVDLLGFEITCILSEYVEGELLSAFIERQPGRKLHPYQALSLFYDLTRGVESLHDCGEYHGDIHSENVLVSQVGIRFSVKLFDFYHWSGSTPELIRKDVCDLVRVFYEMLGGSRHYTKLPLEIKQICCGLKNFLIVKKFKNAGSLRQYIESMRWTN